MYDINMYQYKEKPVSNSGPHYIYPLNEQGLNKFLTRDGHPTKYLNRLDPTILKQLVGSDYDSILNIKPETPIIPKPIPMEPLEFPQKQSICQEDEIQTEQREVTPKPKIPHPPKRLFHKKINIKLMKERPQNEEVKSFQYNLNSDKKSKFDYFKLFHRKMEYEDIFGYSRNIKKNTQGDIYENNINTLKETLSANRLLENENQSIGNLRPNKSMFIKKKVDRCVLISRNPSVAPKSSRNAFEIYSQQLNRSISNNTIDINKTIPEQQHSIIIKKNEDLKNKLHEQTDLKFLKMSKLPPITKVLSSKKEVSSTICDYNKNLGEKYNPYAFVNQGRKINGRNYTGGMFNY